MNDFPSFDAPQTATKRLLEKDIQSACVRFAKARGWWARKFSSPANRSVPDYLFAREMTSYGDAGGRQYFRKKIAVEFKAPGKKSTEAQVEEQKLMREAGWDVYEIDDVEVFKVLFRELEE